MRLDKKNAIKKASRIPEKTLLMLTFCGGFLGTYFAMKYQRHKTKHWQFHAMVIATSILWWILLPIAWICWKQ